jgi:Tfp pilus assembly protein FimT
MKSQDGIGLAEALVVLAIAGIALGAAALYLHPAEAPLQTGAGLVEGSLRQARLQAIATTSAFRVKPANATRLATETASSCTATTWTPVTAMNVALPQNVSTTSTSWSVCFSSRGISTNNIKIPLSHPDYGTLAVEVLIGGTTRIIQ